MFYLEKYSLCLYKHPFLPHALPVIRKKKIHMKFQTKELAVYLATSVSWIVKCHISPLECSQESFIIHELDTNWTYNLPHKSHLNNVTL